MNLWFCMGTAGELIKMFPLMKLADDLEISWTGVHTGQSGVNFWKQWEDFGFSKDKSICTWRSESDLISSSGAMKWFFQSLCQSRSHLLASLQSNHQVFDADKDLFFIHGDTLSTLLGAIYARRLGVQVVHIEAGLRSRYLFQPFPEEINRRLTSELTHWHMVPDEVAKMNLLRAGFENNIVNSGGNTLIDTIRRTLNQPSEYKIPNEKYIVANLHRHENLSSAKRWKRLIDTVLLAQKKFPVYFAMHAPAEAKLNEDIESRKQLLDAGVQLVPRMKFTEFIRLLNAAEFVLSDGGSNQEECYYLGKPCLILRETSERIEGLGENALMSEFHWRKIQSFVENYQKFQRPPIDLSIQPSRKIFEALGLKETA